MHTFRRRLRSASASPVHPSHLSTQIKSFGYEAMNLRRIQPQDHHEHIRAIVPQPSLRSTMRVFLDFVAVQSREPRALATCQCHSSITHIVAQSFQPLFSFSLHITNIPSRKPIVWLSLQKVSQSLVYRLYLETTICIPISHEDF